MKPTATKPDPTGPTGPIVLAKGQSFEIRAPGWEGTVDLSYSAIRSGVPATIVRDLQRASVFERQDIERFISTRTQERRLKEKQALKPDEADGLARLLRVVSHAQRVFEDEELAEEWLRSPNPALNDEVPMAMAETDVGAREVEGVLSRIEHGVFD